MTKARTATKTRRLSPTHRPDSLDLREWQTELRRQFAGVQKLQVRNLGNEPVFSEFAVFNPKSKRTYRVVIRGSKPGLNFCACPDYAVNTLGTCKHIEYVLKRVRRGHAGALRRGYHPAFSELFLKYGARRELMFSPGTDCPAQLRNLADRFFQNDGRLRPEALESIDQFVRQAPAIDPGICMYDDALVFIAEHRDAEYRRLQLQQVYEGKGSEAAWKSLLRVPLLPYQRTGALFAARAGRALIADDMGLGKTIQAIAAAEILARLGAVERVLVICPSSLKYQWKMEIEKFSPRSALVIEGPTHVREKHYIKGDGFFKIVNYDVLHRDLRAIESWRPDLIILDEAQRIKNWETRTAKTVKKVESRFALVLTGTPLENRLEELHSIVEFVDRFRLGPLFAFKDAHAETDKETGRVIGYRNLKRITETLAPILIRRTKSEVLTQLPPRMDKNFFVPMTEQQWVPHNENRETVARIVAKWRHYHFLSEADQLRLRIALQNMRMSCDSTYLIDHETKHGLKIEELRKLLEEIFERAESKVVIFSQWLRMNELVSEMLEDRRWGYVHLHGGVASKARKELVRSLNEERDCRVFLSTDAGGVGLNLQSAATVINMDLPWNPAILEQRIGRVHRMGQRQPVRVVNFISEGTIEQGMLTLLAFKRSVFAGVLDGASDRVFMGESALNRFMKTVETATAAMPLNPPTALEAGDSDDGDGPELREVNIPAMGAAESSIGPNAAGNGHGNEGAGVASFDLANLSQALAHGATLLQAIGNQLSRSAGPTSGNSRSSLPSGIRVEDNAGRKELRISLPSDDVLKHWVTGLSNLVRQLTHAD